MHTTWLNTATFLSDVTHQDDGATAFLSGTHTAFLGDFADDIGLVGGCDTDTEPARPVESEAKSQARAAGAPEWTLGLRYQLPDWAACLARQKQLVCSEGSICFFCETTVHIGMGVLSERTRYAMFNGFNAPWWKPPGPPAVSLEAVERMTGELSERDHRLRIQVFRHFLESCWCEAITFRAGWIPQNRYDQPRATIK